MTWSRCDRALVEVNFFSKEIGWEQYEEILLRVRIEIEEFRCCRIRQDSEPLIRPRVMRLWKRLRQEICRLGDRDPNLTRDFFRTLEINIMGWLMVARGQRNRPTGDDP